METSFGSVDRSEIAGEVRFTQHARSGSRAESNDRPRQALDGKLTDAWLERLRERTNRLAGSDIRYLHLPVPESTTVHALSKVPEHSKTRVSLPNVLVAHTGLKSPSILNVLPYFARQSAHYTLHDPRDARWSFWGCYSAYQLICTRLGVSTNRSIPGYPHSEDELIIISGTGSPTPRAERVRTYQLSQHSRRTFANPLVRFIEQNGLSDSLDAHRGAHVTYRNEHANAVVQTLVLFGSSLSDFRPQLLTGMLAETFRDVHFICSEAVDFDYVARVGADVVITECAERSMIEVPADDISASRLGSQALATLTARLAARIVPNSPTPAPHVVSASAAVTRTLVLPSEQYALDAPIMTQPGCDDSDRDTAMISNPVSLIELHDAKIFFDGAACLVRDANDDIIYRYGLTDEQSDALREADYPLLAGTTHLLGASMGAHCYYHWIVDILPRLGILQKAGVPLASLDNILVREAHRSFQAETLVHLGIQPHQVLATREISHFTCERLLHVTLDNGINMKMNRFVPAWLQHHYAAGAKLTDRIKLYISRPVGVRRGIANEDELVPLLTANGFTVMAMEGLSVKQQAKLLSRADVLVSPHGGALTNMIFCRPGIKVVELFGRHVYPFYYGLAQCCGHEYHALLESTEDAKRLTQFSAASAVGSATFQKKTRENSFKVDPSLFATVLATL